MTQPYRKRNAPFSLRLTPQERQRLENQAAGISLGAYIKSCLFTSDGQPAYPRKTRGQFPVKERKALAALIAVLGQSGIAPNLSEIARLARNGSLPITSDLEAALRRACQDIAAIRALLIEALGIEP